MVYKFKTIIYTFILFPLWLIIKLDKRSQIIIEDLIIWGDRIYYPQKLSNYQLFIRIFTNEKPYRNILYFRLGPKSQLFSWILRPLNSLYTAMPSENVGSGLFICHGFSTIFGAKSIGKNCSIYQQVTIGWTYDSPTIGDNVCIFAGAIVLGGITIGDNSEIGAGAVVTKNVPANCSVAGNPARIVKRDGNKVNEKL